MVLLCILATFSQYLLLLLGPYHFCTLLSPSLHEIFPWYLYVFLKRSLVFPILLSSSIFLSSSSFFLHWSLGKAFLFLCYSLELWIQWVYISFSPLSFTSFLFSTICKPSSDNHFAFVHFFSLGMVLIPVSYTVSQTSVPSSSGTLSIRSNPLNLLSLPLYNCKGFDLGHTWMA